MKKPMLSRIGSEPGAGGCTAFRRFACTLAPLALLVACENGPQSVSVPAGSSEPSVSVVSKIPLPNADQRLCTGVVILVDTSGSMNESVSAGGGATRRKHELAREALASIVVYTGEWKQKHPDRMVQLGMYSFSNAAREVLPMAEFDATAVQQALSRIPGPNGGTAIGEALAEGFKALYKSGCVRKYVLCITDGENTAGRRPDQVARQLHGQTGGEVEIHFVAFDTSSEKFSFLSGVNGHVVEAADGPQLAAQLSEIYEKRILAEEMPAERQ
jgi:hypothetical protein